MLEPVDGSVVIETPTQVRGMVSHSKAIVMVNDTRAYPGGKYGVFITYIELTKGENVISIVVTRGKEVITETITVTYLPEE